MKSHLIIFTSAKDSLGCSTLSINYALLLKKLTKKNALLVDFDFSNHGDIHRYLKVKALPCTFENFFQIAKDNISKSLLEGFFPKHESDVDILQAFDDDKPTFPQDTNVAQQSLEKIKQIYDYIIMDFGSDITPYHCLFLQKASRIFVVGSPNSSAIKKAQKRLHQFMHAFVPKERIEILINHWDENKNSKQEIAKSFEGFTMDLISKTGGDYDDAFQAGKSLTLHNVRHEHTLKFENKIQSTWIDSEPSIPESSVEIENQIFTPFWISSPSSKSTPSTQQNENSQSQDNDSDDWIQLKSQILKKLLTVVDLKGIEIGKKKNTKDEEKLKNKTKEAILKIINELGESSIPSDKRGQLVQEVLNEAIGLGPLEVLLNDRTVSEIMINGKDQIYVEKSGKIQLTPLRFSSSDQLNAIIERIVAPIGRRVDESTPLVDARLKDGSRVNIIIPPLSLIGPTVTIRRFSEKPLTVDNLVGFGTLTESMAEFLRAAIEAKLNLVVSGGTGSGKTTLLNVLSSFIPDTDRIVTIEDAAELQLTQDHVVSLESRPANIEGEGEIPIRTLLKNSLRMRPDRIVIGECRSGEALDMLQAMNTGHDGSLTTLHANNPRDCIARLETLVMYSGVQLPSRAIRAQIASAIHVIVQLNRLSDGSRKITKISEITGMEGDIVTLQDIFEFKQTGVDENRKVIGHHGPTGFVPRFVENLEQRGIKLSRKAFQI